MIAVLRQELLTDPVGLGYAPLLAEGRDNAVADLLNEPRYQGPVSTESLLIWAAKYAVIPALEDAAKSEDRQISGIAKVGLLLTQNPNIPEVKVYLTDVRNMFNALVAAGIITEDQRAELYAQQTRQRSRAEWLGLGSVTADDVARARG